MSDTPNHDSVQATLDVTEAFHRLVDVGLAADDPRGINREGMQTLSDLLAVLIFQAGAAPTTTGAVCSASARATMSALADLLRGDEHSSADTVQLLTAALREAREA